MSISKKMFVLLLAAMVLIALSSVTLVLAGHEALVRDAFRWVTSSASSALEVVAFAAIILFVVVVTQ